MKRIQCNKKLSLGILISIIYCMPHHTHAKKTTFELKDQSKQHQSQAEEKPLFNLLNSESPKINANNSNKWGNNPFFKQQKKIAPTEQKSIQPVTQPLTLFEYKISAIWSVNDEFKALISGHIVKKGDTINELTILKITNKDVTVRRKKKKRTFRLGSLFYDFQI